MIDKNPPVKRLDRDEFAAALRDGRGRALLHVIHYGLDDVADLVLEACFHNQVYDQQLESGRADWLYAMFKDTPRFPEFRNAILDAIKSETGPLDLYQLAGLAANITRHGDPEMRQALGELVYRVAADPAADDWIGVGDWLDLEGTAGMLELARIYGQRLLTNPDDFVNDRLLTYEGHPDFREILIDSSNRDTAIQAYWNYLQSREQKFAKTGQYDTETSQAEFHRQVRSRYSLAGILNDAKRKKGTYGGHYVKFGNHATPDELESIYLSLLSEGDDDVRTRLLWVFRRTRLPGLDPVIFDWADGSHAELRSAAIAALAQIQDDRVHQLAIHKAESGELVGADNESLDLFQQNYGPRDAEIITSGLLKINPDRDSAHKLSYDIRELVEKYNDPELSRAMLWAYENTPCSFCRYQTARWLETQNLFSDAMQFECSHEPDDDLTDFVIELRAKNTPR